MAEKSEMKSKMAFGTSENIQSAINQGLIDNFDILLLDGDTDPKIGWVDKNGVVRIVENNADVDISGIEAEIATKANAEDVTQLEAEVDKKANAKDVDAKIGEIETALNDVANASYTHEKVKYEIADVPVGTLVDYSEHEIRIMCPTNSEWVKQSVGEGGDANTYYCTFKTYFPDGAVGYIEHLGDKVDSEILTDVKTDSYGRRYQPTWLALAKYDETTNTWTYYGENSGKEKFVGWDYRIDFYNADGVMIESDSVRINLSNEQCHYSTEPYYVSKMMTDVETMVNEKVTEINTGYEIIEF